MEQARTIPIATGVSESPREAAGEASRARFHQAAWALLGYNLLVILGGAFVRATVSGDGCGSSWPHCDGQVIPAFADHKTAIEFGHRASTGILLPLVLGMLVWGFRRWERGHPVRAALVWVLLLTLLEAAIGFWLVRYKLVAHDQSVYRAVAMPAHLVGTFLLLAAVALTVWWSGGGARPHWRDQGTMGWSLGIGLLATLLLGISGAITALGDTLEQALGVRGALTATLEPTTRFLLGLRIFHPLIAISAGIYLVLIAGLAMQLRPTEAVNRWARTVIALLVAQVAIGFLNRALAAPVWLQLVHLLAADLFWVSLVLLAAAALAEGAPKLEIADWRGLTPGPPPTAWAPAQTSWRGVTELPPPGGFLYLVGTLPRRSAPGGREVPPVTPLHEVCGEGPGVRPRPQPASWRDYLALTKPRVISLLLFTAVMAIWIAAGSGGGHEPGLGVYLAVAVGFYMAAGAAYAINMVLARDLDLKMGRTATRPTVTERIPAAAALRFAFLLLLGSFGVLWWGANLLSAALALGGLVFYIVVYTLLLKRRTWANIVIGGAAGAFPPLVGWAAVTGDIGALAWCLFGIIFLWTPVHFWALAILLKEDYARAGVPMLPVVRGERHTSLQILAYAVLTAAITALPLAVPDRGGQAAVGGLYLAAAALLNAGLLLRSFRLWRRPEAAPAKALFKYSMVYLALLFLAMAVDRAV